MSQTCAPQNFTTRMCDRAFHSLAIRRAMLKIIEALKMRGRMLQKKLLKFIDKFCVRNHLLTFFTHIFFLSPLTPFSPLFFFLFFLLLHLLLFLPFFCFYLPLLPSLVSAHSLLRSVYPFYHVFLCSSSPLLPGFLTPLLFFLSLMPWSYYSSSFTHSFLMLCSST